MEFCHFFNVIERSWCRDSKNIKNRRSQWILIELYWIAGPPKLYGKIAPAISGTGRTGVVDSHVQFFKNTCRSTIYCHKLRKVSSLFLKQYSILFYNVCRLWSCMVAVRGEIHHDQVPPGRTLLWAFWLVQGVLDHHLQLKSRPPAIHYNSTNI